MKPLEPSIGLNPVSRSTGEIVDYSRLTPYLIRAGYLPALALRYYEKDQNNGSL